MRVRPAPLGLLAVAVTLVPAACSSSQAVTVSDGWSRPVPPVSPASAVFLEMSNDLDGRVGLTGASSKSCGSMELHQTNIDDAGVMTMRPLAEGLLLEPGTSARLAPGGTHLMCLDPEVFEGSFDVELELDGAAAIVTTVTIEDR